GTADELKGRGVKVPATPAVPMRPHLARLDLGEQLLGRNELTAEVVNTGKEDTFALWLSWPWSRSEPAAVSPTVRVGRGKRVPVRLSYTLSEPGLPYTEHALTLSLMRVKDGNEVISSSSVPVATWTVPI